jgi:hypothetical protein
MNLGTGNRRQTILAGVLGVLALVALVYIAIQVKETFGGGSSVSSTPAPVAAPAPAVTTGTVVSAPAPLVVRAAKTVGTTSAALDPSLHMEAMLVSESVTYSGSGRNIFSPNSAPPVVIPKPIAQARLQPVVHPVVLPPSGPPPPPPIDLKFFGFEMSASGQRQAFLLHNDNVYLASAGDVVMRRYRILAIDARAIRVVDLQNNNTQTLPLLAN